MDPLRVLIADDHPLFRNGMRALLSSVPDMEVSPWLPPSSRT